MSSDLGPNFSELRADPSGRRVAAGDDVASPVAIKKVDPKYPPTLVAEHVEGEVILYADVRTQSIQKFLAVSDYRRNRQLAYNREHNITPRSVSRPVEESLSSRFAGSETAAAVINDAGGNFDVTETLRELEESMLESANNLEFEKAALFRDQIRELKRISSSECWGQSTKPSSAKRVGYGKARRRRFKSQTPGGC